ncbi:hypothetical protein [Pyrobaculum aerophilum]|uniref:hypothetical protein n=1 Tax=Pyrobaculum aerophilum TaxID=13773 RepID=UPI002FD96495
MPPKQKPQIKQDKREEQKAKKAVVAALFLALLIAPFAFAQQASGGNIYDFPFKEQVQYAVKNLAAAYALIFWAAVVLLAIYAAVHWIASPVTWARWSSIINVIDHYKAILIGLAAIPFVLAAFIFAANLITTGYGAGTIADAGKTAVDFLNGLLVKSLVDAFGQLKFW